jgi:hypothetical protein
MFLLPVDRIKVNLKSPRNHDGENMKPGRSPTLMAYQI